MINVVPSENWMKVLKGENMLKRKIVRAGIGLLLSLSFLCTSMECSIVSAAKKCNHTYKSYYEGESPRYTTTHQFYNDMTSRWEECTKRGMVQSYATKCSKCGSQNGAYTKEYVAHLNTKCPFHPREWN